ncbi:MAG: DUF2079 domain-containing protein [bacterium]
MAPKGRTRDLLVRTIVCLTALVSATAIVFCVLALFVSPVPFLKKFSMEPRRLFRALLFVCFIGSVLSLYIRNIPLRPRKLALWVCIAFTCLTTAAEFASHLSYQSNLDLAIYNQMLYTTALDGTLLRNSLEAHRAGQDYPTHFAIHNQAVLLLLVPLYFVFRSPLTLNLFVSISYIVSIYIFALIVERKTKDYFVGNTLVFLYAFFPYTPQLLLDFHPIVLFPLFLLSAHLCLYREKSAFFWLFIILSLSCKENVALCVVGYGLALMWEREFRRTGALVLIVGALWFMLNVYVIIPHFRGGPYVFTDRYVHLDGSFGAIAVSFFRNPGKVLSTVFRAEKMNYVFNLLYATAFIFLLRPRWMIAAIPILLQNLLSSYPSDWDIPGRHSRLIVPFLFLAMLDSTVWLVHRWRRVRPYAALGLIGLAILPSLGNWEKQLDGHRFNSDYRGRMDYLREFVPEAASVAATNDIIVPFSFRRTLYLFPGRGEDVEYIVANIVRSPFPSQNRLVDTLQRIRRKAEYGAIARSGAYVVFRRGTADCVEWEVPMRDYDAEIVSATFPTSLTCGELASATIVVKNNGALDWTESKRCRLGTPGEREPFVGFKSWRVRLSPDESIPSGATVEFQISELQAPSKPGKYRTNWRMLREYEEWFGDKFTQEITVKEPVSDRILAPADVNISNCDVLEGWSPQPAVYLDLVNAYEGRACVSRNTITDGLDRNFWFDGTIGRDSLEEREYEMTLAIRSEDWEHTHIASISLVLDEWMHQWLDPLGDEKHVQAASKHWKVITLPITDAQKKKRPDGARTLEVRIVNPPQGSPTSILISVDRLTLRESG